MLLESRQTPRPKIISSYYPATSKVRLPQARNFAGIKRGVRALPQNGGLGQRNFVSTRWPRMFVGNVAVDLVDRELTLSLVTDALSVRNPQWQDCRR